MHKSHVRVDAEPPLLDVAECISVVGVSDNAVRSRNVITSSLFIEQVNKNREPGLQWDLPATVPQTRGNDCPPRMILYTCSESSNS